MEGTAASAEIAELALREATRTLEGQRALVADLRTRAGVVLGAGGITFAVFGAKAVTDEVSVWAWLATFWFLIAAACLLGVLMPRTMDFSSDARVILTHYEGRSVVEAKRYLAEDLAEAYANNEKRLGADPAMTRAGWLGRTLIARFRLGVALLATDSALWVIALWRR